MSSSGAVHAQRIREIVDFGDVSVDVIAEGRGPLVVMLPSRGRGSEDFDEVAAGIAAAGFRVLRPQPRGAGGSKGPTAGVRMQDLARDVAMVIERENAGPAVMAGHAFGNWVSRMLATDRPDLVRGIVLVAAAAKTFSDELRVVVHRAGDLTLPDETRLEALRRGFFYPGHEARSWLSGWAPEAVKIQGIAVAATKQSEYWNGGGVRLLDLVPEADPFKPKEKWYESREEFGERVSVKIIPRASHALIPEQPAAVIEAIVDWARALHGLG